MQEVEQRREQLPDPAPWTVTWRLYMPLSNVKFHLPVLGFRHPCQNDGVSQTLVYNDESGSLGTSVSLNLMAVH